MEDDESLMVLASVAEALPTLTQRFLQMELIPVYPCLDDFFTFFFSLCFHRNVQPYADIYEGMRM